MRILRPVALSLLLALAACVGASPRPTSLRELQPSDLNSCFTKAKQYGAGQLQGTLNLYTLVADDGAVPVAFVHDAEGLNFPSFRNCVTLIGTISKFEAEKEDYLRAFAITCPPESLTCNKEPLNALPKQPMDEKLAQSTLTFADWASNTDKGWGYHYTHQYPQAIAAFNEALKANPNDLRAQRGLAQTLAESGGDLKVARELADKVVAADRNAATLETLIRVCLKQKDDECVVKSFVDATKAADKNTRSFNLADLNEAAKAANDRLAEGEEKKAEEQKKAAEQQAKKLDPEGCYKMEGTARAVCYTRHCFGAGVVAYAHDLKKLMGGSWVAGEWTATGDDTSGYTVTVPLRPASAAVPKKGKKVAAAAGGPNQDATWKVKLDEGASMVAQTLSASNISKDHNACKQ